MEVAQGSGIVSAELDAEGRSKLIAALAAGSSISQAAKASGYHYRHAHRLAHDPDVLRQVAEARSKGEAEHAEVIKARAVLLDIATSGERDSDRVAAARALIAAHQTRVRAKPQSPGQPDSKQGPPPAPLSADEVASQLGLRVI